MILKKKKNRDESAALAETAPEVMEELSVEVIPSAEGITENLESPGIATASDPDVADTSEDTDTSVEKSEEEKNEEKKERVSNKEDDAVNEATVAVMTAYGKGRGMGDEEINKVFDIFRKIRGVPPTEGPGLEEFEFVAKGLAYDCDMAKARHEGEISGRNAKIDELYIKPAEGDGVPHLGSGKSSGSYRRTSSIFDLAREA